MKNKILYLIDNNIDVIGGVEESLKILIRGFSESHKISLVHPGQNSKDLSNTNCKIYSIGKHTSLKRVFLNPFLFINYIFKVSKILKETAPHYVHTHSQASFFIISLLLTLKINKKSFLFLHTERGIYTKYSRLFRYFFSHFSKNLDVIIFTTKSNKKLWTNRLIKTNPLLIFKVIQNATGEQFQNTTILEKKPDRNLTIGFAGRYCDWKNWPLAYEICKKLKDKSFNFYIKIAIGCNDTKSHHEAKNLFFSFNKLLSNNFSGEVNLPFNKMLDFYDNIDIFILTSWPGTESFGRTIIEAMSRETVVLSTPSAGPKEIISNDELICLNPEDFVSVISKLNSDREKLKMISEKNRKDIIKNYSIESNLSKHKDLYQQKIHKNS